MDALTADEICKAVDFLCTGDRLDSGAKFPTLTLKENDKESVHAWRAGQSFARCALAVIMIMQRGSVFEAEDDLREGG